MSTTAPRVRIVTDTTATIPPEFAEAHAIQVVPQIILFGETSFREERDLTYAEFVRRLKASPQLPKTAAPEPGDMIEAYRRQLEHASTVISIHPSSEMSGTIRTAETAKAEAFPDADIRIIDSRTIAGNLAGMVIAAAEWVEQGVDADEIVDRLNALIARSRTYFLVTTLEYLQKGGRIGGASALVGSMLQIKPLLEIKNGRVETLERVRTLDLALKRLKKLVADQCPKTPDARLCVIHADDIEAAQSLAADLKTMIGTRQVPIYGLGSAITVHAGPGALGAGFFA